MDTSPASDLTPPAGNPELIRIIRDEIASRGGQIPFARFMELALYHPEYGYYRAAERRPGRSGDFLTAPETSPYFGFMLARQIAEMDDRLGQPAPFTIREYGSGVGGLAYDIIAALIDHQPETRARLDYRLAEPNPHRQAEARAAMTTAGLADVVSIEDMPDDAELASITGVVLANEVADALPVHRLVVRDGRLRERYVALDGERFVEVEDGVSHSTLGDPLRQRLAQQGVTLRDGDRLDVSPAAEAWFRRAVRGMRRGYVLLIDYGYPAAELFRGHRLTGTLRTYAGHVAGDDPFVRVGEQDLTAHVDFSALIAAGEAEGLRLAGLTSQGELLERLGLGQVLLDAQDTPDMTATDYLALRAGIFRLIDPGGMGRFSALAMTRAAPDTPLTGFAPRS